jgi:DNA-binding beta-propeller fold protein YncE
MPIRYLALGLFLITAVACGLAVADQPDRAGIVFDTGYKVIKKFAIGGDGGWDYIAVDSEQRRLYVSHGSQLEVLDADGGTVIGHITNTLGVHGAAIASDLHRGFTSNGADKSVTIFDTNTLTTIKKVPLSSGTDFILYDSFSKRVFPINEKMNVIEAATGEIAGTVDLGGDPEGAVSDGQGAVYVNLADKAAVAVVDTKTLSVTKRFPIEHCTKPHSLSFDRDNQRLLIGCTDLFVALNATTGKFAGSSLVCTGVDASGFDPENQLVFESCAEGVISVIRQFNPDNYRIIETIPTKIWAHTMAFDPKTKNIYLPVADMEFFPDKSQQGPPERHWKSGSFSVLVVSKK